MNNTTYPIKLGVIGTGRIANRFVSEARLVNGIEIISVYNPNPGRANEFAKKHRLQFAAQDLEELFRQVDVVYIASPHETHYEYIRAALSHEKHVLCEKPMVLKKAQAEELFSLADQKKCILMEGIKTAYCPGFAKVLQVASSGRIGTVRDVEATFTKLTNPELRELTDVANGGSFLELSSYTLLAVVKLLGIDYQEVRFDSVFAENGLDLYTKAHFIYQDRFATSITGLGVKSEGQLLISGTKGYLRVDAPWWKTQSFEVCFEDTTQNEKYTVEFLGDGLRYEIDEFVKAIHGGKVSEKKMTKQDSITLAELMENFLMLRTR